MNMTKVIINRTQVEAYNRLANAFRGTSHFEAFVLANEWLHGTRWVLSGYYLIRDKYIARDDEIFYIKRVGDYTYLYYENRNEKERFCLTDGAEAYFLGRNA
ncbi:MAG: hypothetical protein J6V44_08710 [Methanobrevibacter sp.]|nr:hypothetical protein [Methanobrevibacter sp.]